MVRHEFSFGAVESCTIPSGGGSDAASDKEPRRLPREARLAEEDRVRK